MIVDEAESRIEINRNILDRVLGGAFQISIIWGR